jgi:hypothetical protein
MSTPIIRRQEAKAPESGELNLTEYDGKAIIVSGYVDSGWVYRRQLSTRPGQFLRLWSTRYSASEQVQTQPS